MIEFDRGNRRWFHFLTSDIEECSADPSPCDSNADCTNTDGSYSCTCTPGYTGDGTTCQGRLISIYKSIILKKMWKICSALDCFRVNCCFFNSFSRY